MIYQKKIVLPRFSKGFHLITDIIINEIKDVLPKVGILNIFLCHTSSALAINENADYTVRHDLKNFFNNLVPEDYKGFTHTLEGADDMPSHIKSSILGQSLTIPITNHKLNLGTWQGIYLCEFRDNPSNRTIVLTIIGE